MASILFAAFFNKKGNDLKRIQNMLWKIYEKNMKMMSICYCFFSSGYLAVQLIIQLLNDGAYIHEYGPIGSLWDT